MSTSPKTIHFIDHLFDAYGQASKDICDKTSKWLADNWKYVIAPDLLCNEGKPLLNAIIASIEEWKDKNVVCIQSRAINREVL